MNTQDIIKKVRQYPVVFVAGALSLVLLLVIVFRFGAIADQERRVEDLEDQVLKMERNVENSRELTVHLERLEAANARIDQALINPDNKAGNLDYFYSQEAVTGVVITRVSQQSTPQDRKGAKPPNGSPIYSIFQPVKFDLTVDGDFNNIVHFVHRIASDRYLAKVSAVQINIRQDNNSQTLTSNVVVEMLAKAPDSKP